ncbi:hypothetical protein CLONEX_01352 [[Clostridium] nexile DSM 1787]|nr:hypothetical protein CLONEX_01352 [[Clostridium] nexile DSM 1787]
MTNGNIYHICEFAISIHTPAKGVTANFLKQLYKRGNFNPHSREGSDGKRRMGRNYNSRFQSTLPRRE